MSNPNPPDPRDRGHAPEPSPDFGEEAGQGARGRYGIEEEPIDTSAGAARPTPKPPDEIARDAARDAEVKNTGEDLG